MLFRHPLIDDVAAETVVVPLGLIASGKPARPLVAVNLLKHRALGLEAVVKGALLHRSAIEAVEVWKGNLMAQQVILPRLDVLPLFIGVRTKTPGIKGPHGNIRRAVHHPAGQLTGQARPPANADLGAAATPVVARFGDRADQGVAIWRMGNGSVHILLDAKFGKDGHAIQRVLQPGHHPVVVRLEQVVLGLPGAVVIPNHVRLGLLIDANQAAFLFHADVTRHPFVIADDR